MHIHQPDIAARWDKEQHASGQPFPRKHADLDMTPTKYGMPFDFSDKGSPEFQRVRDDLSGVQHPQHEPKPTIPPYGQPGQKRQRGELGGAFHDMDLERRFPEAHHSIDSLMSHMSPREFKYKNPADGMSTDPMKNHGGFLGVMAQEIERDPSGYGHQIVRTTPHGKMLETKPLVSALTAGVGRLHDRVSQLEGHIKGLMHAAHHRGGAAPNERQAMLDHLHTIVTRKLSP